VIDEKSPTDAELIGPHPPLLPSVPWLTILIPVLAACMHGQSAENQTRLENEGTKPATE
jgi:hypothetical protein